MKALIKPIVMTKSAALSQCIANSKSIDGERRRAAIENLRRPRKAWLGRRLGAGLLAATFLCAGLSACDSNDGPMEKAGESVDKAATDLGNKVEDTCENTKDAAGMKDTRC